jgi:hypothetical protein
VIVDLIVRAREHQIANAVFGQKVVRETKIDLADVAQVLHVLIGQFEIETRASSDTRRPLLPNNL